MHTGKSGSKSDMIIEYSEKGVPYTMEMLM